jgi:endonuclease G
MKSIVRNLVSLVFLFSFKINSQSYPYHDKLIRQFEYPAIQKNDSLCLYNGFLLAFNCDKKLANWVAYTITKPELLRDASRSNLFRKDPDLRCIQAGDDDYRNSGFDRGHLAPSADFTYSKFSNQHTFFFTNMAPQRAEFNRGIWKDLEEELRAMCVVYDSVSIVTGPIFSESDTLLGVTKIPVPKFFFKAIIVHHGWQKQGAALIIANKKSELPFTTYLLSIDSLEKVTSIDFFPMMNDDEEKIIEEKFDLEFWSKHLRKDCGGCRFKDDKGDNCNNLCLRENVFCTLHSNEMQSNLINCNVIINDKPCKKMTRAKNGKCWSHQKEKD